MSSASLDGKNQTFGMSNLSSILVWSQSVTTMVKVASMENAEHPTSVPVRLAGKDLTVTSVFPYQDVTMAPALMPSNATANLDGREHIVTSQAVETAPMATAFIPMNASATMAGQVKIAISVNQWLDVSMASVLIILTLACAIAGGRATFVTSRLAIWIAITDSVTPPAMEPKTFASANLDGEERAVTSAAHTGGAPTRTTMPATFPMSASVSRKRPIQTFCATTPFSYMTS